MIDAAYVLGLDVQDDGRSALPLDYDGDGDLDLALLSLQGLHLFENQSEPNSFARLSLRATLSDAQALGAVVRLTAGGITQQAIVRATDGFQTQRSLELHFGLGSAEVIQRVDVVWPSGERVAWFGLPAGARIELVQGTSAPVVTPLAAWPAETRPDPRPAAALSLEALDLSGAEVRIASAGKPTVVNFWAPWCVPCRKELPELRELAEQLGTDVQFVGLSVERDDLDSVRDTLTELALGYPQLVVTDAVLEAFHGPEGAVALPSTFLFDAQGELRRVYRRSVEGAELAQALESLRNEAIPPNDYYRLGIAHTKNGDVPAAKLAFERAIELGRDDVDTLLRLGEVLAVMGDPQAAMQKFERALSIDDKNPEVFLNIGMLLARIDGHRSIIALAEAVRLGGNDPEALRQLAREAEKLGDLPGIDIALELHARIVSSAPSAKTWTSKGLLLGRHRRYAEAVECFESALAIDASYTKAQKALEKALAKRDAP